MKRTTLNRMLPLLVKGLAQDLGLKAVFNSATFSYDGDRKEVHYPPLPYHDPDVRDLAVGATYHEVGHHLFTDWRAKEGKIHSHFHRDVYQSIEDVRMERRQMARYRGAREALRRLVAYMVRKEHFPVMDPDKHPPVDIVSMYVLYRLRYEILEQDPLKPVLEKSRQALVDLLPPDLVLRLDELLDEARSLQDTAGSVALSTRIVELLEDAAQNARPQSSPNGSGTGATDPQKDGESQQILQTVLDGKSELDVDIGDIVAKVFGPESRRATDQQGVAPVPDDSGWKVTMETNDPKPILELAEEIVQPLRLELHRRLQSVRRRPRQRKRHGAHLLARAIHQIPMGETRVFRKKVIERCRHDTAVMVLLDRSGSMKKDLELAQASTLALGLALDTIPAIAHSAAVFRADDGPLKIIKPFGMETRQALINYTFNACGDTPLGKAVTAALDELAPRQEKRKVLLVVTDGEPYELGRPELEAVAEATSAIGYGLRAGVEFHGIGIRTMVVEKLFPSSVVIDQIGDLPDAMFRLLSKSLIGRAA